MMRIYPWLCATLILTALSACTVKETEKIVHTPAKIIDTEKVVEGVSSNVLKAQKLVESAEPLLSPVGFFFADEIIDQALEADPTNRQAQFYKAYLAPLMKMRGHLTRVGKAAHREIHHDSLRNSIRLWQVRGGGLHDFLHAAADPIRTEEDFRKFVASTIPEWDKLIRFIKANRNFVTHAYRPFSENFNSVFWSCRVDRIKPHTYKMSTCPTMNMVKVRMNRADWESLLQAWTGSKIGAITAAAYDADGMLKLLDGLRSQEIETAKQRVDLLKSHKNFGRLREDNRLKDVLALGSDLHGGMKWLLSVQGRLCSKNDQRLDHLFFSELLCIDNVFSVGAAQAEVNGGIGVLDSSIRGNGSELKFVYPVLGGLSGKEYSSVRLDLMAPFKNPIKDFKTQLATKFTKDGAAANFGDASVGGVFPDANAEDFLKAKEKPGTEYGIPLEPGEEIYGEDDIRRGGIEGEDEDL